MNQRPSRGLATMALGLACLLSAPAAADPTPAQASPAPSLDRLLQLPDGLDYAVERRGGATRGEWRSRFREAFEELASARAALASSQLELEGVAEDSEGWLLAPPGVTEASQAPLSYRLRQEIRRNRAEVERAEQQLRELEIEAELAGVPREWRRGTPPPPDDPPPAPDARADPAPSSP